MCGKKRLRQNWKEKAKEGDQVSKKWFILKE